MLKLLSGFAFFLFLCPATIAQLTYTGDISVPGPRNPRHLSAIENPEGHVVIAGACDTREKGSDITVQIVNKRGDLIAAYLFGGLKDDGAYSIIGTPDGGYVLAGYTDSKWTDSKGGRDAFLLKISRFGIPVWHHVSGTIGDDEWRQVVLSPSGDLIVGGYYGPHPAMMSITAEGKVNWERNWVQLNAGINTIGIAGESVFFAGWSGQKPRTDMFTGVCDLDGILQRSKIVNTYLEATSLLPDADGEIIIAGHTFTKGRRTDGVILRADSNLDIMAHHVFGGLSDDKVHAVTALPGHGFLITGHSFSMSKGARRPDIWVEMLSRDFRVTGLKERYYGNSQEDMGFASVLLTNNTLWTIGCSHPGIMTPAETRVLRFDLPAYDVVHDPGALIIAGIEPYRISGEDDIPDREESGYFTLHVKNNSVSRSAPVMVAIKASDPGLWVPDSLVIPSLAPGDTRPVYLSFFVGRNISAGEVALTLHGLSQDVNLSVPVRPIFRPEISLAGFSFHKDIAGDEVELRVRLINEGNGYLSQGVCYFTTSFKAGPVSADEVLIENLAPRQEAEARFVFRPLANYNEDSVKVSLVLRSDEASVLLRRELTYSVERPGPVVADTVSGIAFPQEPVHTSTAFQAAVWVRPDPTEQGYKIEHQAPEIDIRLRIISSVPIDPDSLYLTVNGIAAVPGVTYRPESAQLVQDLREAGYQYTYTNKINLIIGENIIRLVGPDRHEPLTGTPLVVDYIPKRFDLHVFAIGIPQEDLKFTAKDARDFAEAFSGQSGKLFREVNIHLRNTHEATTTSALRFALQDIANDYYIREKINRDDMIMVYISSHGFQIDGQEDKFKIAASDFNWLYKSQTSLDFREDILDVLSSLPCKKLLLLDACYSGAIADIVRESGRKGPDDPSEIALSRAIARLVESQNDFQVITSSGPGQRSYEDEAWGNSAFMLGLLEAMGKTPDKRLRAKADPDSDSILYLSEIYNFIKTRIPEIVLTKKPRPADIQTPWMIAWE